MPRFHPLCPLILLCASMLCSAGEQTVFDHADFDRILRNNVRDEQVDYLMIRKNDWDALNGYLDRIASAHPAELSRDEQLALYVNLYNATMIRAVIERFHDGYSPSEDSFKIFNEPLVRVGGKAMTLNELENKVIRPTFKEPRVHVALVCAAQSCPPIMPRAYRADDLDRVLESQMRAFVNDRQRNRADLGRRRLLLSRIFDWYGADFGGKNAVANYVDRYHPQPVSGFDVEFLDYSWKLNVASPSSGEWVKVTAAQAAINSKPQGGEPLGQADRGVVFELLERVEGWLLIDRPFGQTDGWIQVRFTAPFPAPKP